MNSHVDPPFESKDWGQDEWQAHVDRKLGAWIDAMLEADPLDPMHGETEGRKAMARTFKNYGLIVSGSDAESTWRWRVRRDFGKEDYQRLMDL